MSFVCWCPYEPVGVHKFLYVSIVSWVRGSVGGIIYKNMSIVVYRYLSSPMVVQVVLVLLNNSSEPFSSLEISSLSSPNTLLPSLAGLARIFCSSVYRN